MSGQETTRNTTVYTDGACIGNPGSGGWAWVISETVHDCGSESVTTNQRMELFAVLMAVNALSGPLVVVSDSAYVVNCFKDGWWVKWRANNWRNSKGEPVANRDLWEPLLIRTIDERQNEISFRWVKGHAGNTFNELADSLANKAARDIMAREGKK